MPTSRLPAPVRRLLEGPIDTFEKLELVLALFRSDKPLSVAELERTTEDGVDELRAMLADLARSGLVSIESAGTRARGGTEQIVRLVPKEEQGAALNELARLYDEDSVVVVKALSQISLERIRGMAARTFADAFQLRRKKDEDG